MVRIGKPVRNYFLRREQWRLWLLVASFGLVVILMEKLRDPQTAQRMDAVFAMDEVQQQTDASRPTANATAGTTAADRPQLFPGIQPELLPTIQDNTYFRNAESAAWFHFIDILQRADAEELVAGRRVAVEYTQLVDQPNAYRGKLVTVRGFVREVTEQQPAENELGLATYYRIVVQPADGVNWPIFVYCLERPRGELISADDATPVAITGVFFKNLSYSSQDGLGTAPVIIAGQIDPVDRAAARPIANLDNQRDTKNEAGDSEMALMSPDAAFREILMLAGWTDDRLAEFAEGETLSDEQRTRALELLRRLRSFDAGSLQAWASNGVTPQQAASEPEKHRGELARLAGQVTKVTRHRLQPADAERLEMGEYFECQMDLASDAGTAVVFADRVPRAWLQLEECAEPASAIGLFAKRLSTADASTTLWLAREVAWHPTEVNEPHVSFGKSVLGTLGMDVGLLDQVEIRGRLQTANAAKRSGYNEQREAFYQVIDAVGRIGANQLVRFAEGNLPQVRDAWKSELEKAENDTRRILASTVIGRAEDGRYSVAPLFNEPEEQVGQLVVVDGVARRAVRVALDAQIDAGASDITRRFGIDHYYELQVFTDDSQNYPLVFCVRELPDGFPLGSSIDVPVRVAGFFFKSWLYRSRGTRDTEGAKAQSSSSASLYAPLLIGRAPVVLPVEQGGSDVALFVGGGLFVLVLLGIAAAALWTAREDRRFRDHTLAPTYSLPPGQSLDELQSWVASEPMKE